MCTAHAASAYGGLTLRASLCSKRTTTGRLCSCGTTSEPTGIEPAPPDYQSGALPTELWPRGAARSRAARHEAAQVQCTRLADKRGRHRLAPVLTGDLPATGGDLHTHLGRTTPVPATTKYVVLQ